MNSAFFSWSGGKDSSIALYHVINQNQFDVRYLLTSINEHYDRVSMHGLRSSLLMQQIEQIGIPLKKVLLPELPSMEEYEEKLSKSISELKSEGIQYGIYGDIFLEDLKAYRENQMNGWGINTHFPIWKQSTAQLIEEFITLGFKAKIICVNGKQLDKSFAGRDIDHSFLSDLPKGVDPCGENGEYHSFVYDGPIFSSPITFNIGETVEKNYKAGKDDENYDTQFYFCDLLPV